MLLKEEDDYTYLVCVPKHWTKAAKDFLSAGEACLEVSFASPHRGTGWQLLATVSGYSDPLDKSPLTLTTYMYVEVGVNVWGFWSLRLEAHTGRITAYRL